MSVMQLSLQASRLCKQRRCTQPHSSDAACHANYPCCLNDCLCMLHCALTHYVYIHCAFGYASVMMAHGNTYACVVKHVGVWQAMWNEMSICQERTDRNQCMPVAEPQCSGDTTSIRVSTHKREHASDDCACCDARGCPYRNVCEEIVAQDGLRSSVTDTTGETEACI